MTLEAGALTVLQGVALGLAGVVAVFVLVIALERKLPHKKMLIATGLLITWVLVVMVGTTVQTMQKVGWIGVTPIEGLELPYWAGLWLGVFPTWQGVLAQGAALVFVLGSYFAAEQVRKRRRARLIPVTPAVRERTGSQLRGELRDQPVCADAVRLAARAVPRAAAADARLRDRLTASRARLSLAPVDPELVLHAAGRAVGLRIVA